MLVHQFQFVWGLRYIDDLVIRDRSTANNGTMNERRYAMQDGNWNTIAICDSTGSVGERYAYSAYGAPVFMTGAGTVQSSSPIGFETLYAGYRWDNPAPQMYYVRNRFLLPQVGTWNKRDPLGYVLALNLMQYGRSRSVGAIDPFGLLDEIWRQREGKGDTMPKKLWGERLEKRLSDCNAAARKNVEFQASRGCIGYSCLELGIPKKQEDPFFINGPPNLSATICFKSLEKAREKQVEMNKSRECKGKSCAGGDAKARIVELQFASVDHGVKFIPQPSTPNGEIYNLEENSGLPKLPNRTPVNFWEIVHCGGPGVSNGFGNFDVAILLEDDCTWLHAHAANYPPKLSTGEEMNAQYIRCSGGSDPGEAPQGEEPGFWFDARFWCVVCETPYANGAPEVPKI